MIASGGAANITREVKRVSTAEDAVRKKAIYIGIDTEFRAYSDDDAAPPLACYTWYVPGEDHASIADREAASGIHAGLMRFALANKITIVGHHVSTDNVVMIRHDPSLIRLTFDVYDAGFFEDTLLCEKLDDIARGRYNNEAKGKFVDTPDGVKLIGYALDECVLFRLKRILPKDDATTYRARFGELIPHPLAAWPLPAIIYATRDAKEVSDLRNQQEQDEHDDPAGVGYYAYADAPAQARAGFALQLMRVEGINTDPVQTERITLTLKQRIAKVEDDLISIGFVRPGYMRPKAKDWKPASKDTKKIKEHIANVAAIKGIEPKRTPGGDYSMDAEAIEILDDPSLEKLLERNRADRLLQYTKVLSGGFTHAIHSEPNALVANGRISWGSDSPDGAESPRTVNLTNLPTEPGIRECYVPRLSPTGRFDDGRPMTHANRYLVPPHLDSGNVFWECDYKTLELCTVAQCCIDWFGFSRLAELLNSGADLHSMLGAQILNIDYDEFVRRRKTGDKLIEAVRDLAKRANFGLWGGMGYERFLSTCRDLMKELRALGIVLDINFVKRLKTIWLSMYPETRPWFQMATQVSEGSQQIVQFVSKRLRGGLGYTDAANAPFSGRAADGAKEAMYCIQRECYADPESPLFGNAFMVAFIHDAFFGECFRKIAHIVVPRVREIGRQVMQRFCPDVRIDLTMACSLRWRKGAHAYFVCPQCGAGGDKETCKACGIPAHLRVWEESTEFKDLLAKGELFA